MPEMNKCERAEQLVAYCYGETDATERRNFERHLSACPACRDELAAFGEVRGAVREWRAEVLSQTPALTLDAAVPVYARNGRPAQTQTATVAPRRTALDALREFFTLSPAWLRAGMIAAALLICALAVAAIGNAQLRWDDSGKGIAFGSGWHKQAATSQTVAVTTRAESQPTTAQPQFTQADIDRLTAERDAARNELAAAQQQAAVLNAKLTTTRAQYQTALASAAKPRGQSAKTARAAQLARRELNADDDGLQLSDLLYEVSATREQRNQR